MIETYVNKAIKITRQSGTVRNSTLIEVLPLLVSNEVLRREDNIPVFSAKGCSFETDVPKLSSKIRRETTLNLSTVKGGDIEYLRWALPEKSEVMR